MAKQVDECTIGVDVAKDWLDLYDAKLLACFLQQGHEHLQSGTAALMALARKLVRVCYALLVKQVSFDPEIRIVTCDAT